MVIDTFCLSFCWFWSGGWDILWQTEGQQKKGIDFEIGDWGNSAHMCLEQFLLYYDPLIIKFFWFF